MYLINIEASNRLKRKYYEKDVVELNNGKLKLNNDGLGFFKKIGVEFASFLHQNTLNFANFFSDLSDSFNSINIQETNKVCFLDMIKTDFKEPDDLEFPTVVGTEEVSIITIYLGRILY